MSNSPPNYYPKTAEYLYPISGLADVSMSFSLLYGLSYSVDLWLLTDVEEQSIGSTFKGQNCLTTRTDWPLEIEQIKSSETSVTNNQPTLRDIPKERKPRLTTYLKRCPPWEAVSLLLSWNMYLIMDTERILRSETSSRPLTVFL